MAVANMIRHENKVFVWGLPEPLGVTVLKGPSAIRLLSESQFTFHQAWYQTTGGTLSSLLGHVTGSPSFLVTVPDAANLLFA